MNTRKPFERMSRFISHRGNLTGPEPEKENTLSQIQKAILLGFDVEIDVWMYCHSDSLRIYLGHDKPEEHVSLDWLKKYADKLWIHAKNLETLGYLAEMSHCNFHYFFHKDDEATHTNLGCLWLNKGVYVQKGIINQPPLHGRQENMLEVRDEFGIIEPKQPSYLVDRSSDYVGICSDYILLEWERIVGNK